MCTYNSETLYIALQLATMFISITSLKRKKEQKNTKIIS